MPNDDYPITLHCHPATPAPMVRALEARAAFNPDGSLTLAYRLWGDTVRLAIPQPQPPTAKATPSESAIASGSFMVSLPGDR